MQTIITFASLDLYKEEAIGADVETYQLFLRIFLQQKWTYPPHIFWQVP